MPPALSISKNFAVFFCVTTVSNVGGWMQRVVLGLLVWQTTESAFWLGAFVAVEVVTAILVGPIGGVWTDRQDARKLVAGCCLSAALASFALALLSAMGQINFPILVLFSIISGLVQAVAGPATQALIAIIFRENNLPSAVALNSVVFNVARFIGPVLALFALDEGSYSLVFLLNGLSFLPQIIALRIYNVDKMNITQATSRSTLKDDLKAGFSYVLGVPAIAALLTTMAATSFIARPFMDLIPSVADRQFERLEDGTVFLTSACGVGALIGGLVLAALGKHRQLRDVPLFTTFLLGFSLVVLSLTNDFHFALAAATTFGLAAVTNAVSTISLLQLSAIPKQRGRVMAYYFMIFRGGMSLGALVQGMLQDNIGPRSTLLFAGSATLLTAAILCRNWRRRVSAAVPL